ncbi:MAG: SCO family protein [Candidatus Korobacteraceae bacterium]
MRRVRVLLAFVFILFTLACSKKPAEKRYELQGEVVAVDSAAHQITVAHQDIAGLMPGMTMPFLVAENDQWVFGKIGPGDQIHATLVLGTHAELQDISFTKQSAPISDGTTKFHLPNPGDQVPDFSFINQDAKRIHLAQFRGRPLLLTFIYTRCPLPDFCLRMSNNFSEILKQLHEDPKSFEQAQLLSISIDPEHDKPDVLRQYGKRYVGDLDPSFQHWQFATGSPQQIQKAADYFGLSYNQKSGQIVHSLSTVLIDSDGKVVKVYLGNDWKPSDVAAAYAAAIHG